MEDIWGHLLQGMLSTMLRDFMGEKKVFIYIRSGKAMSTDSFLST